MIRRRREKLSLELKGGAKVKTMDELRGNFDLEKIIFYLENGKLEQFLRERFYADEADALQKLRVDNAENLKKICEILGVNFENFADLAEEIFWRRERLERLKKFTNDEKILAQVDDVAFDQDDLEDILSAEKIPATIYLCNKIFRFPSGILRLKNIRYVGIGKVTVIVESKNKIDFNALKISLENVELDKAYGYSTPTAEPSKLQEIKKSAVLNSRYTGHLVKHFVKTAARFKSDIYIEANGKTVSADSAYNIDLLRLGKGDKITITAKGIDSAEAVDTLIKFIKK